MSELISHLEGHLGRIVAGWSQDADGRPLPFQVVLFEKGPISGTKALSTLGLSTTLLRLNESERQVRQELVMLFREEMGFCNLPGVMQQLALEALAKKKAYVAGEVIGPRGELITGSTVEALYVAVPVYFSDSFHVCRLCNGEPIVFAWLVPITAKEANFARDRGWAALEELLERQDPDLLDFRRESVV